MTTTGTVVPILETALGTLLQGCGIEWLEGCPEGSVDLVVADPPYNMGKGAWDRFASMADYLAWTRRWVQAARRALSPTGSLYVMGWPEVLAEVQVAVASEWAQVRWLVWFYRNKANLKDDWGRSHESLLLLRRGRRFTFNTDPVRIPYNAHTVRYPERSQAETSQYGGGRREGWQPHPLGARPRDVIEVPVLCNGTPEKTAHPTQKPVQLIRKLVLASSNPGDLVVDPFAGSGTTALVAELHGRRWVSCDLDPGYLEIARRRLEDPRAHAGAQTTESEAALAARRGRLRAAGGEGRSARKSRAARSGPGPLFS
jgi:site-specific DNA-methyltransferase (adenine-specific)